MTAKEFDLLYFLFCHKGQVFTKNQLYENVWGFHNAPEGSNLTSFIRKLRKKIEPFPDNPQYILTVWGAGYNICIFTNLTAHTIIPPIKLMRGASFDGSQAASPDRFPILRQGCKTNYIFFTEFIILPAHDSFIRILTERNFYMVIL